MNLLNFRKWIRPYASPVAKVCATAFLIVMSGLILSGCDSIGNKKDNSIGKFIPLLLTSSSGPVIPGTSEPSGPACPNYTADVVMGANTVYYPKLVRLTVPRSGSLYVNFSGSNYSLTSLPILYNSSCTKIPEVSSAEHTRLWEVTPGIYYIQISGTGYSGFYLGMTRLSGCSSNQAGVRFKNNYSGTWTFRLYDAVSCGGGTGYTYPAWNNISSGNTSGYGCVTGFDVESPGAYDGVSSYICGGSTSTFDSGSDYTIEFKSDASWVRSTDF